METFYIIVLSVAIVFLILSLTSFGILLKKAKSVYTYPKNPPNCPDYWTVVPVLGTTGSDGTSTITYKCRVPENVLSEEKYKTYYNGTKTINDYVTTDSSYSYITFTGDDWEGTKGACNKYKWATTNGWVLDSSANKIKWDGVTNVTPAC